MRLISGEYAFMNCLDQKKWTVNAMIASLFAKVTAIVCDCKLFVFILLEALPSIISFHLLVPILFAEKSLDFAADNYFYSD